MFSTDEPMLANHFTMASIDIPSDVEVVVRILAENGARYRFDASSLEAVTPSAEHPYGDPNAWVAWQIWGGDAAKKWVDRIMEGT